MKVLLWIHFSYDFILILYLYFSFILNIHFILVIHHFGKFLNKHLWKELGYMYRKWVVYCNLGLKVDQKHVRIHFMGETLEVLTYRVTSPKQKTSNQKTEMHDSLHSNSLFCLLTGTDDFVHTNVLCTDSFLSLFTF